MSIVKKKLLNKMFSGLCMAIICGTVLVSCSLLPEEEEVLAPPLVEPAQTDYETAEVEKGDILNRVRGTGALISETQHDLYFSKDGGRLEEIFVAEGDYVEEGEVLAEIETGNLAFDIQQSRLDLQKAELRLKQMQEREADKYDLEITKLDIQGIKNHLYMMNTQLTEATLKAPINGHVTFVSEIQQGEGIPAYQTIVQVADVSQLLMEFTAISESDIVEVKTGMEAIAEIKGEEVKGKVAQTPIDIPADILATNPEHYNRTIVVAFDETPEDVTIGALVNFEIITERQDDTLIIPKSGLRSTSGRNYVQIMEDSAKREVDVEIGVSSSNQVEILDGLNEGDVIILQ